MGNQHGPEDTYTNLWSPVYHTGTYMDHGYHAPPAAITDHTNAYDPAYLYGDRKSVV